MERTGGTGCRDRRTLVSVRLPAGLCFPEDAGGEATIGARLVATDSTPGDPAGVIGMQQWIARHTTHDGRPRR